MRNFISGRKRSQKPIDQQKMAKLVVMAFTQHEDFIKEFNKYYQNFTDKLLEATPHLSKRELYVCTFLKIGLKLEYIANIGEAKTIKAIKSSMGRISVKLNKPAKMYLRKHIETL